MVRKLLINATSCPSTFCDLHVLLKHSCGTMKYDNDHRNTFVFLWTPSIAECFRPSSPRISSLHVTASLVALQPASGSRALSSATRHYRFRPSLESRFLLFRGAAATLLYEWRQSLTQTRPAFYEFRGITTDRASTFLPISMSISWVLFYSPVIHTYPAIPNLMSQRRLPEIDRWRTVLI